MNPKRKNKMVASAILLAGLAGGYGANEGTRQVTSAGEAIQRAAAGYAEKDAVIGSLVEAERMLDDVILQLHRVQEVGEKGGPFMALIAQKSIKTTQEKMKQIRERIARNR